LEGLLVLSLEQAVAAPLCTARLADAGARVIKVERAEGDFARGYDGVVHGESAYFVWLNRGKQSLVADIKQAKDAALLHRILKRADIFVQNLAPGAAARAGFGSDTLRRINPALITCDISGYGSEGPYKDMKAYDLLIQCESGLASITGGPEAPGRVGVSAADICCGMNAHAGILEALVARNRTGRGAAVATSLFDGLADWMAVPLLHQDYGGRAPSRVGLSHASIAPYGAFTAGDGVQIVLAVQNEREWRAFCEVVLQQPGLAQESRFSTNASRVANRGALDAQIEAVLERLTGADLAERLQTAQIAFGRLNDVAALSVHPQLRRMEVATPTGSVSMPAPPVISDDDRAQPGRVPKIGADTSLIQAEFAT
jgi:crotonobetainyl-CoA:carnitine CoA-transferase CaiB-like acyl-CoA transferase